MKKKRNIPKICIITALILCLISAIGSNLINTNGGQVKVTNIKITTPVGELTGYLYVPDTASTENTLPALVVSHGANSSSESVQSWSLELARRGYIIFAPDMYGHGSSSLADNTYEDSISSTTNGLYDAVEYLYSLSFVDKNNVGIAGHSLGGGKSVAVAEYYSDLEKNAIKNGASEKEASALNKTKVCITVGYPLEVKIDALPSMSSPDFNGINTNLCVILGKADDFQSWMNKDILTNEYGKKWINTQTGITINEVTEGKLYTSTKNGCSLAIYNPNETHNFNLISSDCIANMSEFLNETIPSENSSLKSQIWGFKLAFDFIGIIGFFMFILPCIYLVIKLPVFSSLLGNDVKSFPPLIGQKKRKYIHSVVTGAILNTVLLLPCVVIGTNLLNNPVFPQGPTSGFAFWGVVSGLFTFLFVKIGTGHKIFKNKEEFGLNTTKQNMFKIISIALITVAATYSLVYLAKYFFNSTFQCWTYIIRVFDTSRFLQIFRYLPLFGIQQLANSIATSRNNFENWSDGKRIAFSTTLAVIPVILIMSVTYIPILFTGSPMWGSDGSNLILLTMGSGSTRVFNFIFSMASISFINVKTQKLTGNVWLGAIINTLIITITSVAGCSTIFNF